MPKLTIDNQTITVPEGTNVLEAAKLLGIVIPHFCYHEALGAVGACRLCAMSFTAGPVKGIQMACMVEARDEMVISTVDPAAVELRQHVIEWLMVNHPHDCPVCDEGGECQLQDMTIAGGHGIRRFGGLKRTYSNQQLGPFIEHEMNRCIQCYRCVRTYQDYCGGDDFGVLGSRDRVFFGRFKDGKPESPFSGNLVDICPTGVFTDKTFRFKTRYWDIEEAPSICPHCSLGCATIPGGRYRELQRTRGGVNRQTNGFFICDRGRFGYGHVNHPDRPRTPRIGERQAGWAEAVSEIRARLAAVVEKHGPRAVAFLGSSRASLEANALLRSWAAELGSDRIAYDPHQGRERAGRALAALLGERAHSAEQIRHSDFVLFIGADPYAEGPMLALAARQAVRAGAKAAIIDPRPVQLPFKAAHLPLAPERLAEVLQAMSAGDFSAFPRHQASILEGIARQLNEAKNPVIIGGCDLLAEPGVKALIETATALSISDRNCGAALLLAGPNSFGAALLAGDGPGFNELLDDMQEGSIKALVCLEADPFSDAADPAWAQLGLGKLELLVALDYLDTPTARKANAFLPTAATAEAAGSFVNFEGRLQGYTPVITPGVPIREIGAGDHPPRTFEANTPGSLPRPAWAALQAMLERDDSLATLREQIEAQDSRFAGLAGLDPEGPGILLSAAAVLPAPGERELPHCEPGGTLRLLAVESLFGTEILSSRSAALDQVIPEPRVLVHPDDALRFGLAEGDQARLSTEHAHARVTVRTSAAMAPGLAIVPRLRGTALEQFAAGCGHLDCVLEKGGPA